MSSCDTIFETASKLLQHIELKNRTVSNLIKAGELRAHGDVLTADNGVVLETIYGTGATITICKFRYSGGRVSEHIHKNISQYLVCVKGSFNVLLPSGYRILSPSACVSIPPNCNHTITALEDEAELIAVCVPPEKGFLNTINNK